MIPPLYRTHTTGKADSQRTILYRNIQQTHYITLHLKYYTQTKLPSWGADHFRISSNNIVLIYFSWGTVRIQLQQHQKAIWKLVTPIWWWVRFSATDTACTYLSIHLKLPYLQTKIRTWRKYKKYFLQISVFIYVCAHARTHHTNNLDDNAYYNKCNVHILSCHDYVLHMA